MLKISPIKSGLEAFQKFKADRIKVKNNINSTNPFGITFKGTVLQMDVFESAKTKENNIAEKFAQAGKFLSSAWAGTINRFSTMRDNIISFTGRIKDDTKAFIDRLNQPIKFDFITYNVSNLEKRPVNELRDMMNNEIKALGV